MLRAAPVHRRLAAILLLTLALRAAVAAWSPAVSRDTCGFVWFAQDLAAAPVAALRDRDQHPGYPALILALHAPLAALLPADPVRTWQLAAQLAAMLGAVGVTWLAFLLTRRLFDDRTALIAAFFAAVLPESVQFSADGLSDLPHTLCYLTALAAGAAALRSGAAAPALLCGLLAGAAYLIRPEGLGAALAVLLLLAVPRSPLTWRRRTAAAALVLAGLALVAAPYVCTTGDLVHKKSLLQLLGLEPAASSTSGTGFQPVNPPARGPGFQSASGTGFQPVNSTAREAAIQRLPLAADCATSHLASALPLDAARAVAVVLENWLRCGRIVYILLALLGLWLREPRAADVPTARALAAAWLVQFCILVALVLRFDYWQALSKRHVLLLVLLLLPFAARGAAWIIDRLAPRLGPARAATLVLAVLTLGTAWWMLRPIHAGAAPLVRAGRWIAANRPDSRLILTTDARVPFYAGCRMQNWDERSGSPAVLRDHLDSFRPDLVCLEDRRLLRHNPDFFDQLDELLVRPARLREVHVEAAAPGDSSLLRIYEVAPP